MSIGMDLLKMQRAAQCENLKAIRFELGEKQARDLADYINLVMPPADADEDEITWEYIMLGGCSIHGVPLVGVESPDYLHLVTEP